ncbi:hypothetical protein GCM10009124_09240 [Shewanella xiamenensis]|nr:hypothetical protein GCM10009124_09240 [Shewanella xiamenensis]
MNRLQGKPIKKITAQAGSGKVGFPIYFIENQALLDEAAVLACMTYVDYSLLKESPIRSQLADTPEQSDHTSIQLRIRAALKGEQPSNLLPFIGNEHDNQPNGIAFALTDYLQLVEDTGRIIRNDKRGYISESSGKLLNRLNIPHDNWLKLTTEFGKLFHGPVGTLQALTDYCKHLEKRRRHFAASCQHFHCNR